MSQDQRFWEEIKRIDQRSSEVTVQMAHDGIANQEWEQLEDELYELKQEKRALQRQRAKEIRGAK
jgi:hypothetical protein